MKHQIIDALAQAESGIALFDANERIIYSNPAWEQLITGIAEEDLLFSETELRDGGMISVCVVKPQARQTALSNPVGPNSGARIGTIIIADDSDSNRMVARRILQAEGYGIVEANTGQAVLNMLRRGVNADLILMDVEMPDMDGLHATRRIRHMAGPLAHIPIIALSAHQSRDWNVIARQSGVDEFITKPLQRGKLIETVRDLIAHSPTTTDGGKITSSPPPVLRSKSIRLAQRARPQAPSSPVLDIPVLEQLLNDAGNEGACCAIDIFIHETQTRLATIDKALSKRDLDTVHKEIHALKSTSGTFGLRQLSELCENTQSAFEEDELDDSRILALSQQVVQLAPPALNALNLYRRSRRLEDKHSAT